MSDHIDPVKGAGFIGSVHEAFNVSPKIPDQTKAQADLDDWIKSHVSDFVTLYKQDPQTALKKYPGPSGQQLLNYAADQKLVSLSSQAKDTGTATDAAAAAALYPTQAPGAPKQSSSIGAGAGLVYQAKPTYNPALVPVQKALGVDADGLYGAQTKMAVSNLQKQLGYEITGNVQDLPPTVRESLLSGKKPAAAQGGTQGTASQASPTADAGILD